MKKSIPFFLSYAHNDSADVKRLQEVLQPLLATSAEFAFGNWADQQILPGEHWREEIVNALQHSCFGLLLVSPQFLSSNFITEKELPPLLSKPVVVPVALHRILFDGTMELKGLEDRQVFHDDKKRSFDRCRTMPDRRQFATELFTKLTALLRKYSC